MMEDSPSSSSSASSQSSDISISSSISSSGETYTKGIRLKRFAQRIFHINHHDGFRFRVLAYDATGMPNKIFRWQRKPDGPGKFVDVVNGICSSVDLEEYPEDDPNPDRLFPFLRLDELDVVVRSIHDANAIWTAVQDQVRILVETLVLQEDLVDDEILAIGNPQPGGD